VDHPSPGSQLPSRHVVAAVGPHLEDGNPVDQLRCVVLRWTDASVRERVGSTASAVPSIRLPVQAP